ncbi:MAG: DUF3160 domain-containing protein [bacterium]
MRHRFSALFISFALVAACGFLLSAASDKDNPNPVSLHQVFHEEDLAARFGKFYQPADYEIEPSVPSYSLPLKSEDIKNRKIKQKVHAGDEAWSMLLQKGIVSMPYSGKDDVVKFYKLLDRNDIPVFVTSDSLLHLYHIQFDETLRHIEEKEFYDDLLGLSRAFRDEMQDRFKNSSGLAKKATRKGLAFFSVALKLLDPEADVPPEVRDTVKWELEHIEAHQGFPAFAEAEDNSVFSYPEDYSQYVPRGHYTRSEKLERYFKAMMWYGRMVMLLKGDENYGHGAGMPALVPPEEARVQTILAATVAGLMSELKVKDKTAAELWSRLYSVTAYYVGLADDLTPQDYRHALRDLFGDSMDPAILAKKENMIKLKTGIAQMAPPKIYSGTGAATIDVKDISPDKLDDILAKTVGMRFLGQRYVPDSYILSQLVIPEVTGKRGEPSFTTVKTPMGPARGFPRGLDVMAVLGSDRSLQVLERLGDSEYKNYDNQMEKLRQEFSGLSDKEWNRNMYWSWLYALKSLVTPVPGKGYPSFMTTDAWKDKELNAALGSWAALRHDTILYVKQSYTPKLVTSADPPPMPPVPAEGYVEPVPEFYARLLALTRMTKKGLGEMEVLDHVSRSRLSALERIIGRLLKISKKELENQRLSDDDLKFIDEFGESLQAAVTGADSESHKTSLVADVHTDQNSGKVLEEATGNLRMLLVAYRHPEGNIRVAAGPVYSYYEFKHPMDDRLTDEKWQEMLAKDKAPDLPEWTDTFAVK